LRFLLDENVSPIIGKALSAQGHDVLLASSACRGSPDEDVVALAVAEDRVLISEDKDFGELAFRDRIRAPGLVRLVLPASEPEAKAKRLIAVLAGTPEPRGGALVVEPNRTRFRRW
jgi:hypothetical protein